jgi:hypothetical protein
LSIEFRALIAAAEAAPDTLTESLVEPRRNRDPDRF